MIKNVQFSRGQLLAGAALLAMTGTPAFAQGTPAPSQNPSTVAVDAQADQSDDDAAQSENTVTVTGTLFRGTAQTPSPVTTLTAANLESRGINTVTEAIQRLSANGAGTLPNSFSANGAFASGASAPSLRGLTTNSTLVLFDGLRAAYYPLADDGTRNFVDINSIPDAIVDRIDVLKDGASSTYGADAVAGVVNIITKKQITGVRANASAGISSRGDTAEQRADLTVGYGDLTKDRFNVYVSGEYQKDHALFNRDRGYPYNTSDLSRLCTTNAAGALTCRANGVSNGIQFDGAYTGLGTTIYPVVRPGSATNALANGSSYNLLNAAQGCGNLPTITLNAAQLASQSTTTANLGLPTVGAVQCQQDARRLYGVITPEQERIGGSVRSTLQLGDVTQAYGQFNYYQSDVFYTGAPAAIRFASPAGGTLVNGALPTSASIALPIYVCPLNGGNATFVNSIPTTPGCTAANGTLNPNNPFAASGRTARIITQLQGIPLSNRRLTRSYRGAGGINGSVGNGFDYSLDGVYMKEVLKATYAGYPNLQQLFNVVADGSYNFVNQLANTQAVRDRLAPTRVNRSTSELYQIQGSVRKDLFNLPGGPLGVAVGAAYRHEEVVSPSANPVVPGNPFDTVNINRFGTSGRRNVKSAYFEVNAPVFDQLLLNASGRYDKYSSGQHNFSPKVGARLTPIRQVSLVGTYSRGFRIPSFAESFGLPTTGFVNVTPPSSFQAACTGNPKPNYCTAVYSLGQTQTGNPNLKPEKSRNFTAGAVVNPVRNISMRVDYYNIKKRNLITGIDYTPQIAAYYASGGNVNTLIPGVTGITVDTVGFATQVPGTVPFPLLSTIQFGFINANSAKSSGVDFDLEASYDITPSIKFTSSLDATYVIELSTTFDTGVKQRYEDSLGPYQVTSASGTPQWRGSWQNTVDFGKLSVSGTAYYTAGYSEGAADAGNGTDGQFCGTTGGSFGSFVTYRDNTTIVRCRVKKFIYGDLTTALRVNDQFTLYANVLNFTNEKPPYDPSTYGASNYNPAWGNSGIIGRYYRVGARVRF